ncbi:MAG: MBL fold metallo-hydrolase, partial [Minwuiales bacterium]|nr:MBL fold metallo-hydrolase [Minwuiales bacterium]
MSVSTDRRLATSLVIPRLSNRASAAAVAVAVGLAAAALPAFAPPAAAAVDPFVRSFAAQPKLVDTTNTHWLETEQGIVVIDTQRVFPEAERAIRHIRRSDKPVLGIFITHAHTDHYGGLSL